MALKYNKEKQEKATKKSDARYRVVSLPGLILSIFLWVSVVVCLGVTIQLNIFPALFIVFFGIVWSLIAVIVLLTQFTERMYKKGMIAAVLFCPILGFVSIQIYHTNQVIDAVTDAKEQTVKMQVITRVDDKAKDLRDVKDYTFGIQKEMDASLMQKATGRLKKQFGEPVKTKQYFGLEDQIGALYSEKVDAIILNVGLDSLIQQVYKSFDENTKIVGEVTLNYKIKAKKEADLELSPFNILVTGVEEGKDIETNTISTTNLLVCGHPDSKQMLTVNIPYHYYLPLGDVTKDKPDLLGIASATKIDYLIEAVEALYETHINYFAKFDMNGLSSIIDALGVIKVESDHSFHTEDGRYYFKKGFNHMDGQEALAYWNELEEIENAEIQRTRNQEYIIQGIFKKLKSPFIVLHYSSILDSIERNFRTNLSAEQVKYLIRNQFSSDKKDRWQIASVFANGIKTRKYTYYSSERSMPVIVPVEKTNSIIYSLIKKVQRGESLTTQELVIPMVSEKKED